MSHEHSLTILADAQQIMEYIIEKHDEYFPGTKLQLCCELGGKYLEYDGVVPKARVDLIERACQYTKDRPEEFAGIHMAYAPNDGGVAVIDPESGEMPPHMFVHVLRGDFARQTQHETENRRRMPMYDAMAQKYSRAGDNELARICYACLAEIKSEGRISQTTRNELMKALKQRGLFDE